MTCKLIGLSGFAGSGKDTFYELLKSIESNYDLKFKRVALADILKNDIDSFLKEKVGISAWTKNRKEKEIIRPMLVSYGKIMRTMSEGKYWTNSLQKEVDNLIKKNIIPVITDIRYCEYPYDEVDWLKKQGGKLIYIQRVDENNKLIQAPNEDEKKNDPLLRCNADVKLKWKTKERINLIVDVKNVIEKILKDAN